MKYLKTHSSYALLSALITTLIVMAEILFLNQEKGDVLAEFSPSAKSYAILAVSYFGIFAIGYFLALACVLAAEKIVKKWILSYAIGFAIYFAILGIFMYTTGRVGILQAYEAGIWEFFKNFAAPANIVMTLQVFTISFAFIRIARKKHLSK